MDELSVLLASVEDRLEARNLQVTRRVKLPGGPTADLIGSRTCFSWKGLALISQHVLIRSAESATREDAEDLFDAGFRYAKKVNREPLSRGLQFGYMVIPCLVVSNVDDALVRYANRRPRKHWAFLSSRWWSMFMPKRRITTGRRRCGIHSSSRT